MPPLSSRPSGRPFFALAFVLLGAGLFSYHDQLAFSARPKPIMINGNFMIGRLEAPLVVFPPEFTPGSNPAGGNDHNGAINSLDGGQGHVTVAPGRYRVLIQSRGVMEGPRDVPLDSFLVTMEGPIIQGVIAEYEGAGTYHADVTMTSPGRYDLRVRALAYYWNVEEAFRTRLIKFRCKRDVDNTSTLATARVTVRLDKKTGKNGAETAGLEFKFERNGGAEGDGEEEADGGEEPRRSVFGPEEGGGRRCGPSDDIYSGYLEAIDPSMPPPQPEERTRDGLESLYRWRPNSGCGLKFLSRQDAAMCLRDKWVVFGGDSTTEDLAASLLYFLHGAFNRSYIPDSPPCRKRPARVFDSNWVPFQGNGPRSRVSHVWTASADPCWKHGGLHSFGSKMFKSRFKRFVPKTRPPDFFVFSSGHHDLTNGEFSFPGYEEELPRVLAWLQPRVKQLVWKTTGPRTRMHECGPYFTTLGNNVVALQNNVSRLVAGRMGLPVLDQFSSALGLLKYYDGLHCTNLYSLHDRKAIEANFRSDLPCWLATQLFLYQICSRPAS